MNPENEKPIDEERSETALDATVELASFQKEVEALSQADNANIHLQGIDVSQLSMIDMQAWVTFKELEKSEFPETFVKALERELGNIPDQGNQSQASRDFIAYVRTRLVIEANRHRIPTKNDRQ